MLFRSRGGVREGNDQFPVSLCQKRGVLSLGVAPCLLQLGSDFVGVAVEVLAVVPEEAVLRTVFVRVSGSALSFRIGFVSGGTTRVCGLPKASLLVVLLVVLEQRWFRSCFVSDHRTSSSYYECL